MFYYYLFYYYYYLAGTPGKTCFRPFPQVHLEHLLHYLYNDGGGSHNKFFSTVYIRFFVIFFKTT